MKKSLILSLLMLSACGLPREQIKAENAQKLSEMQIQATNDMHQKEKTDKQYLDCLNRIKTLENLANKASLTTTDIDTINQIYSNKTPHSFSCAVNFSTSKYKEKFSDYCYDKYQGEVSIAEALLFPVIFPLRVVNLAATIATLGIFPFIQKPSELNQSKCSDLGDKISVKPGKTYFNDNSVNKLKQNMTKYCQTIYFGPRQKLLDKVCDGKFTKGCFVLFNNAKAISTGSSNDGTYIYASVVYKANPNVLSEGISVNGQIIVNEGAYFIYGSSDYYEGQAFETDGIYFEYVGNYNDGSGKRPAFKRSGKKVMQENDFCESLNPEK